MTQYTDIHADRYLIVMWKEGAVSANTGLQELHSMGFLRRPTGIHGPTREATKGDAQAVRVRHRAAGTHAICRGTHNTEGSRAAAGYARAEAAGYAHAEAAGRAVARYARGGGMRGCVVGAQRRTHVAAGYARGCGMRDSEVGVQWAGHMDGEGGGPAWRRRQARAGGGAEVALAGRRPHWRWQRLRWRRGRPRWRH